MTTGFGAAEPAGVVEEAGGFTAGAGEGFGADVPDMGALTIGFGVTPEVEGVTEAGFGAGVPYFMSLAYNPNPLVYTARLKPHRQLHRRSNGIWYLSDPI